MAIQLQGLLILAFGVSALVMGIMGVSFVRNEATSHQKGRGIVIWLIISTIACALLTLDRGWSAIHGNQRASQVQLF